MRTIFLTLLFCICTFISFAQPDWYVLKNDSISISFPKEPQKSSQSVPTAIGDMLMDIYSYESGQDSDSNLAYVFITSTYPGELVQSSMTEKLPLFFRSSIDGAVKNVNGKLLTEKEISIKGFPGREATIDYGNGVAVIHIKMYLVRNKGYFVQTISPTGAERNLDANKFLSSFQLIE